MTASEPDFLDFVFAAWRADIKAVPFPTFADLLIPGPQQRRPHIVSPECWCQPCAATGRWQHRGPEPHTFEPGPSDFQPGDREDITRAGQPTAIHQ